MACAVLWLLEGCVVLHSLLQHSVIHAGYPATGWCRWAPAFMWRANRSACCFMSLLPVAKRCCHISCYAAAAVVQVNMWQVLNLLRIVSCGLAWAVVCYRWAGGCGLCSSHCQFKLIICTCMQVQSVMLFQSTCNITMHCSACLPKTA